NLDQIHEVGNITSTTVSGLQPSTTYYLALQAFNTAGIYSNPTAEIVHTTQEPPATGLTIHDESGNRLSEIGESLDLGMARLGALGDDCTFVLTNHGPESVSGLRWFIEDAGAENFVIRGMPLVALLNTNSSFEKDFHGWSNSGRLRTRDSEAATHGDNLANFSYGDGPNDGVLHTTFPTVPGKTYRLEFDLGVMSFNTNLQRLRASLHGGQTLLTEIISMSGIGAGLTVWEPKNYEFTADSEITTLFFEDVSSTSTAVDLNIDHVKVIDVAASSESSGLTLPAGGSVSFSVRFKPTRAGARSAKFRLMKDGDSDDAYRFNLHADGSVSFDEWLVLKENGNPAVGGGGGNPLLDFAFGLGPDEVPGKTLVFADGKIVSRGKPAVIPPAEADGEFRGVFVRKKDREASGLLYHPQFSSDLVHWHDADGVPEILAEDGAVEIASLTAPNMLDGKPARFFRVGVSQVAPPSGHDFVEWLEHYDVAEVSPGTEGTRELTSMLIDYAFGLPPGASGAGLVAEIDGVIASRGKPNVRPPASPGEAFNGLYARRKNHAAAGLEYRPQFSADLIHWHDAPDAPVVLADDGEIQVLTVSAPELLDGMPARFFRVGVNGPLPEPPEPVAFDTWMEEEAASETPAPHHVMAYAFGLDIAQVAGGGLLEINGNAISRGVPNANPPPGPQQASKGICSRRKAHSDVGLSYRPQFSADLIHWHDAPAAPVVIAEDGDIEAVSVTAPEDIGGQPARFFRVGIRLEPES
ncbi:MAG TPA: hypothetical protein VLO11_08890, partial [Luteolibacter sp.]|nr:hypothetical protein [Luteolibacter sp.]